MRKILNEVFGVCGFGWGYSYEPGDLVVEVEERKTKTGGTRRVHVASLKRVRFWYKLNGSNVVHMCDVYASGGSDNEVEAYALSGAITNAIGKAASNLGFQESVYLGKRSHHTVGKKSATSKPVTAKSAVVSKVEDPTLAGHETKSSQKSESASKAKVENDEIVDDPIQPDTSAVSDAASFVIPTGRRQGQKLGDQSLDVIGWYANEMKSANPEQKALQSAAQQLLKVRSNGHEPVAV
jgi:hypothetical protein